jgi:hypothetical protein
VDASSRSAPPLPDPSSTRAHSTAADSIPPFHPTSRRVGSRRLCPEALAVILGWATIHIRTASSDTFAFESAIASTRLLQTRVFELNSDRSFVWKKNCAANDGLSGERLTYDIAGDIIYVWKSAARIVLVGFKFLLLMVGQTASPQSLWRKK